jgi:hypothetical protein
LHKSDQFPIHGGAMELSLSVEARSTVGILLGVIALGVRLLTS